MQKQARYKCENYSIFSSKLEAMRDQVSNGKGYQHYIFFCPKCQFLEIGIWYPVNTLLEEKIVSPMFDANTNKYDATHDIPCEYCQRISNASNLQELLDIVLDEKYNNNAWQNTTEDILTQKIQDCEWGKEQNFDYFCQEEYKDDILQILKNILIQEVVKDYTQ